MGKHSSLLIILIVLNLAVLTGCKSDSDINSKRAGQLPARKTPQGFKAIDDESGSGRVLTGSFSSNARSATDALTAILGSLGSDYFDSRPTATGAFCNNEETLAQALFKATLNNVPVRGVAAVMLTGSGGYATVVFDKPESFRDSFPRLIRQVDTGSSGIGSGIGRRGPAQLQRHALGDGSGEVGLPSGWQLQPTAGGTVMAVGPERQGVVLGGMNAVSTNPALSGQSAGLLFAAYSNPQQVLVDVMPQISQGTRIEQIIESVDAGDLLGAGGQSAYIHYRASTQYGSYEGLALIIMGPSQAGLDYLWSCFYSFVTAPAAIFKQELPTLLAIWNSWKLNGQYLAGRLMEAAQTMRSTSEIITQAGQARDEVYAKANEAWSEVLRGQATVEDVQTGGRGKADINDAYYIVQSDPTKYRIVPLSDLNVSP
ncbi:MAG TPA: hypothetical protein VNN73_04625 [Blastocatellia bacterium]|nr:hypothetical protein [Blastocatellia bacterium]